MADFNTDWTQLISDVATLEADDDEASDDDESADDDESDAEFFDPLTLGLGAAAAQRLGRYVRTPVHRARPKSSYGKGVKGKGESIVRTPNGELRLPLPGHFVTVDEFQKTAAEIQKDMKQNSAGIKDLADLQRKESQRLEKVITTLDKKIAKQQRRSQIVTCLGFLAVLARQQFAAG